MKKYLIAVLLMCLCLLTACTGGKKVCGEVIEIKFDGSGGASAFTVEQENGKIVSVLMTDETSVISWVKGVSAQDFLSGKYAEAEIKAECDSPKGKITVGNGEETDACNARRIEINSVYERDVFSLSDSTQVDRQRYTGYSSYILKDGVKLLRVNDITETDFTRAGEISGTAKANILAYFDKRGVLYDIEAETEKAYADYKSSGKGENFGAYFTGQETVCTASNGSYVYFLTDVSLPKDSTTVYIVKKGTAFDVQTGQTADNLSLFSCAPNEVGQKLAELSGETDEALREQLVQAFDPENIVLYEDVLELCYPAGTLEGVEAMTVYSYEYEKLTGILSEDAIPA